MLQFERYSLSKHLGWYVLPLLTRKRDARRLILIDTPCVTRTGEDITVAININDKPGGWKSGPLRRPRPYRVSVKTTDGLRFRGASYRVKKVKETEAFGTLVNGRARGRSFDVTFQGDVCAPPASVDIVVKVQRGRCKTIHTWKVGPVLGGGGCHPREGLRSGPVTVHATIYAQVAIIDGSNTLKKSPPCPFLGCDECSGDLASCVRCHNTVDWQLVDGRCGKLQMPAVQGAILLSQR